MSYGKLLATTMIVLSLGAAFCYVCVGDYRRAIYWTAAAIINASVTY